MTESGDESPPGWDETVDVVCVGTSPGVLAYAICCAENDLDILFVRAPAEPDEQAAAWYAAMTADLVQRPGPGRGNPAGDGAGFSFARLAAAPEPTGKRAAVQPFIGESLRRWSEHCLQSPFGVMFSQVPDLLVPMRTAEGESVTAAIIGELGGGVDLASWLRDCAREAGLAEPQNTMAATISGEGGIAGVRLDDGYRVAARGGLVWPVGADVTVEDQPGHDGPAVAIVGRPAGRFARVDLLRR